MKSAEIVEFEVSLAVFPLPAVYAASYIFTDRAFLKLDMTPAGTLLIEFKPKPGVAAEKFAAIEGDFRNELLHHALRHKITENNQKIREYIVTQALLAAQPAEDVEKAKAQAHEEPILDEKLEAEIEELLAQVEKESQGRDPLKITVPWQDGSNRKSDSDASAAQGRAGASAAANLEKAVESLLDRAEQDAASGNPDGGPIPVSQLADKAGRDARK